MRRLGTLVALCVLLAACGSSGREASPLPTARPPDLRVSVERAQLTVADLGGDWKLTATEPPHTSDTTEQSLGQCVGKDLAVVDETEFESESRTFERGTDLSQQQVVSSSAAFERTDLVRRLFRVVGGTRFASCMTSTFEDRVRADAGSQGGVSLEAAPPTVVRPAVTGAERSVHITAPVKVHLDGFTLDGRFDVVLLSTGRVVSMLLGFSVGDPIPTPQFAHLLQLLLDRQRS